jgi:hypothetical protein
MCNLTRLPIAGSLLTRFALLAVLLLAAAISARPADVHAGGSFIGTLPGPGSLALVVWSGGPVEEVTSALADTSCPPRSVWATRRSGGLVGYLFGAPAAVNSIFQAEFAGGLLPAQTSTTGV